MRFVLSCFIVVLASAVVVDAGSSRRRRRRRRKLAVELAVELSAECDSASGWFPATASPWECRAAMAIVDGSSDGDQAGDTFQGSEDDNEWPSGCYYCKNVENCTNGTWFNKQSSGQSVSGVKQYCQKGLAASLRATPVLFLGDSDVDYWPATTNNFVGSHNVGVGGYTCKDVLKEIKAGGKKENMLRKYFNKPNTLVLVCGENDIGSGKTVSSTFKALKDVLKKAKRYGKVKRVIYLGTKPEPSTTNLHSEYRRYDEMVKTYALDLRNAAQAKGKPVPLVVIDVYSAFEALGNPDSLYANDKLHLSSEGYDLWNNWTQAALDDTAGDCLVWQGSACNDRRLLDVMV